MKMAKTGMYLVLVGAFSSVLLAVVASSCRGAKSVPRTNTQAKNKTVDVYEPTWESLAQHPEAEWFQDAKFGIYTHWGIYSVPAWQTEWYGHGMYMKKPFRNKDFYKYHTEHYGAPSKFGYKDFIPMFTGEKFDAEKWAELFKKAGARFAGPVAEHHDGFAMWDSELTKWDAKEMGPKVDVVGQLAKAIKQRGMKFVTSFHHARNWKYYAHEGDYDTNDPRYAYVSSIYGPIHPAGAGPSSAFLEDWQARVTEVIDKYEPDLLWFDGGWGGSAFEPYKRQLLCYYYNKAEQCDKAVVVTYKGTSLPRGAGILDFERGRAEGLTEFKWLTDTSLYQNSWGYIKDLKYYSADWLIDELVDIVSKNGNMLLNVGPKPNGEIPAPAVERLLEIGKWLDVNGEAIYGTRPWKICGEGPTKVKGGARARRAKDFTAQDVRFTTKGRAVYAICLDWPGQELKIKSFGAKPLGGLVVSEVKMVGVAGDLQYKQEQDYLTIKTPEKKPCKYAYVFKITLQR